MMLLTEDILAYAPSSAFGAVVVAFVLAVVTALLVKRNSGGKRDRFHNGKPLPPVAPVGYRETIVSLFGDGAHIFLLRYARQLGAFYCLPTSRANVTAVISDPDVTRKILDDPRSTKPFWGYGFADLAVGGDNIFSAEGHRWRHVRKGVAPAFRPNQMDRVRAVCKSVLGEWVRCTLSRIAAQGTAFDVTDEMQRISVRIIVEAGFNYRLSSKEVDAIIESFDSIYFAQKKLINPLRLWLGQLYADNRRAKKSTGNLIALSKHILHAYRESHSDESGTSDSSIIALIDKNEEYRSDEERLRDMLVFLQAGYDSTGATLSWTLLELAKNTDKQAALRAELREARCAGRPAARLKLVIRESMRLNPIAAFGPIRSVPFDVDAGPFVIPKGSTVFMPFFAIHRNDAVFKNPDSFQPDRWKDGDDAMNRCIMPYATGRRNCLGQAMANTEIEVVLSELCADFEFSTVDAGVHDHFVILKPKGAMLSVERVVASK